LYDAAGVDTRNFRLEDLPIIKKDDVRAAGAGILAKNYSLDNVIAVTTSGSTGKPLTLYYDKRSNDVRRASKYRSFSSNGYHPLMKTVTWKAEPVERLVHKFGIHREIAIKRTRSIEDQLAILNHVNAEVFYTNASQLLPLIEVDNIQARIPLPKIIFTDSEQLGVARERIAEAFGVEPLDTYGSREFGFVAWECTAREGYHVNADLMIVEIINPDTGEPVADGDVGNMVITDFNNAAAPLIRYDTEDRAAYALNKRCSCGRVLPLLKDIDGRAADIVTLPSGRRVTGQLLFLFELREFPAIHQYQVVREAKNRYCVKLKVGHGKLQDEAQLLEQLHSNYQGLDIRIEYVANFAAETSGKFKPFISKLDSTQT
jgi:phenylacetate-CoA ligase